MLEQTLLSKIWLVTILPMVLRLTGIGLIGLVLLTGSAAARRPWQPKVTIEPAENIGRRIPELDPRVTKRFRALFSRAEARFSVGRYRQARQLLAKAIRLNPDHVDARILHARVLLTLGYLTWNLPMIQEARGDVRHAQGIDPRNENLQRMVELLDGLLKRMNAAGPGTARGKRPGKRR